MRAAWRSRRGALRDETALSVTACRFSLGAGLLQQAATIITATGARAPNSIQSYLAGFRGQEWLCRQGAQETIDSATKRGEGFDIAVALYALAILHNGLGRYPRGVRRSGLGVPATTM